MATQKRLSPRTKAKQWVITAQDAIPPDFEHRIQLDGTAYLVLSYRYNPSVGYEVEGDVELDGEQFDEAIHGGTDEPVSWLWPNYIRVHFPVGFMANRYTFELPANVRRGIERRLELLRDAPPMYTEATIVEVA
jgi:hypothetical protein